MGHDIFVCLERVHTTSDVWELLAEHVSILRQYTLFTVLAGVYNYRHHDLTPISLPRGLPTDLSLTARQAIMRWEQGDDEDFSDEADGEETNTYQDDTYYSYLFYPEIIRAQHIYSETEDDIYQARKIALDDPIPPEARVINEMEGWLNIEEKVRRVNGPHLDLQAVIAYLKVYEDNGYRTRMVFGLD